jgi:hypothetical protein
MHYILKYYYNAMLCMQYLSREIVGSLDNKLSADATLRRMYERDRMFDRSYRVMVFATNNASIISFFSIV